MRPTSLLALLVAGAALAAPKLAAPGLNGVGLEPAFAAFAGEHLAQQLREQGLEVVTSSEIGAVLGLERQRQLLDCGGGSSCMAELANALGADGVVLGDLAAVGQKIQLNVKIISAKDARVLSSASARVEGKEALLDGLTRAARQMAPEVAKLMASPLRSPRAEVAPAPVVERKSELEALDGGPCGGEWCAIDVGARKTSDDLLFEMNAVMATGPDNVWAVGYGATALRYDGKSWQVRNPPATRGGILKSVWGTGPTNMIAVGQNGVAFRWKGGGWQDLSEPGYAPLHAVQGLPDGGSVWAGGDKGLYRLEGTKWAQAWDGETVYAVLPLTENSAWAVGRKGTILRFDGKRWAAVDPGLPKLGDTALYALWASGPNDVWMAGSNGVVVRYQGKKGWTLEQPTSASLLSLWGSGPRNVWAAGTHGVLLHWDGEDWMSIPTSSGQTIFGITGHGEYDLWLTQNPPDGGVVHLRR